jgi:hypothetical protein
MEIHKKNKVEHKKKFYTSLTITSQRLKMRGKAPPRSDRSTSQYGVEDFLVWRIVPYETESILFQLRIHTCICRLPRAVAQADSRLCRTTAARVRARGKSSVPSVVG